MEPVSFTSLREELDPDWLQSGSIFGAISRDAIEFLLQNGRIFRVRKGEEIFAAGTPGDSFFIVCQGALDFYKQHRGEQMFSVWFLVIWVMTVLPVFALLEIHQLGRILSMVSF